jgi:hypothetical protein
MNIRKFKLMALGFTAACNVFGAGNDPFSQAGTNIFEEVEKRDQARLGNQPPAGATDYVPSNSVPGQRVPGTPSNGEGGQLGFRATNTSQSPLASYMDSEYTVQSGSEGGQQASQQQQQQQQQQPPAQVKGAFDSELKDFDGLVSQQSFVRPEDAEVAERATKGDKQALMDLINSVGRRAVASASFISTQVAKHGVTGELESYGKKLPDQLMQREFSTMFEGPQAGVLANPKVAAMAPDLANRFRKEYPSAPPAAIKRAVEGYLKDLTGYNPDTEVVKKQKQESGWDNFFNS